MHRRSCGAKFDAVLRIGTFSRRFPPRRRAASAMIYLQVLANGVVLGGLYACIAVGFSLVWGVLNVINLLHGSFIVLGAYVAFFAYHLVGLHPFLSAPLAGLLLFVLGYGLQRAVINRVIARAGADDADADLRPRSRAQQRDAGRLQGRLSQGRARSAARLARARSGVPAARPRRGHGARARC